MESTGKNIPEIPVFDSYIDPKKGQQKFAVVCREEEVPGLGPVYKTRTIDMPVRVVGRILEFLPDYNGNEEGIASVLFNGEEVPVRIAPMDEEEKRRTLNTLKTIKRQMMPHYLII